MHTTSSKRNRLIILQGWPSSELDDFMHTRGQ